MTSYDDFIQNKRATLAVAALTVPIRTDSDEHVTEIGRLGWRLKATGVDSYQKD